MAAKKGLQATIVDYTDYTASFHCAVSYLLCAGIQQNKLIAMLKHVTCTEAYTYDIKLTGKFLTTETLLQWLPTRENSL